MVDTARVATDDTERPAAAAHEAHRCPVCGNAVDPRKTTQALHREGRLMLFCSSGCLREFMQADRDAKAKADKPTT